jgi:hypothetical protein
MAQATHKIVATVGKYKDRQTGEEKKRYLQCGVAFTDDQGRISLKIDAMPVSPEWSGFLSLYPLDDDRQEQRQQPPQRRVTQAPPRRSPPGTIEYGDSQQDGMEDSDIPF